MAYDGGQLGREREPASQHRVVERLLAEPVARQNQLVLDAVPEREREHAVEPVERRGLPFGERGKNDLRVGMTAKAVSEALELLAKLREVIDLAVVSNRVAPVGGGHRLVAEWRQIKDRQPSVTEHHAVVDVEHRLMVGSAMGQ